MVSIVLGVTTGTFLVLYLRERRLTTKFARLLVQITRKMKAMDNIIAHHGCAPDELHAAGSLHVCDDCGTIWEALEPEVEWLDESLRNVTRQRWNVSAPKEQK